MQDKNNGSDPSRRPPQHQKVIRCCRTICLSCVRQLLLQVPRALLWLGPEHRGYPHPGAKTGGPQVPAMETSAGPIQVPIRRPTRRVVGGERPQSTPTSVINNPIVHPTRLSPAFPRPLGMAHDLLAAANENALFACCKPSSSPSMCSSSGPGASPCLLANRLRPLFYRETPREPRRPELDHVI